MLRSFVPIALDDHAARIARMMDILEELRLNTEDLHGLAKQALERARQNIVDSREALARARDRNRKRQNR
jgi:hypothetical protein